MRNTSSLSSSLSEKNVHCYEKDALSKNLLHKYGKVSVNFPYGKYFATRSPSFSNDNVTSSSMPINCANCTSSECPNAD